MEPVLVFQAWLLVLWLLALVIWHYPKACVWVALFLFLDYTVWKGSFRVWHQTIIAGGAS